MDKCTEKKQNKSIPLTSHHATIPPFLALTQCTPPNIHCHLQLFRTSNVNFSNIKILLSKSVCKNHNNQTSHHVSASSFPSPVHSTQFATPNLRLPMLTSRITITIIHDHRLQTIFMFNTPINHGQFRSNHLLIPSKKKKKNSFISRPHLNLPTGQQFRKFCPTNKNENSIHPHTQCLRLKQNQTIRLSIYG